MCPKILVASFVFMASLIRKSRVDISTHRQEGVNRTLNVWIQKLQNICQLKGGVEHANNCLDFARPAAVSG